MSDVTAEELTPKPELYDGSKIDHIVIYPPRTYPDKICIHLKGDKYIEIDASLDIWGKGINARLETKRGSYMIGKKALKRGNKLRVEESE